MKIQLDIDLTVPRWLRLGALLVTPAALLVTAAVVHADVPHTWKPGEVLTASRLNQDFAAIHARLQHLEAAAPVYVNPYTGKRATVAGTFCGAATSPTGDLGGYEGAKALCEEVCLTSTAHMCSAEETVRYEATGAGGPPVPEGLMGVYATGIMSRDVTGHVVADCLRYRSTAANDMADALFLGDPQWGYQSWKACNAPVAVLCCD